MTVKAILKEDNLRMEKFATVMAIYLILFRGDIDNLPFKIGYNLYAFATAVMAAGLKRRDLMARLLLLNDSCR